jgi:hypothetical protein
MDNCRREQEQSVMGPLVEARPECLTQFAGMLLISGRVAGPVFGGFELTLAEGVVVADPGASRMSARAPSSTEVP